MQRSLLKNYSPPVVGKAHASGRSVPQRREEPWNKGGIIKEREWGVKVRERSEEEEEKGMATGSERSERVHERCQARESERKRKRW